ncbi:serine hydrolase domain-containing protein [Rhodohalobacter sulfatireducens]|uniref:Beta-lactamase family protein n=1 Tax=Rhodohalobacter sulfatireducens TaxID=2911366 RepID=A0ABS9K9J5_9BACT|nr:serine hydrolase domain-containing protein [Rhodohalobacter sulfatireducens]MCG2587529.1 beta-lactamase family protein [Rhodohalobacter sulfatireducens]
MNKFTSRITGLLLCLILLQPQLSEAQHTFDQQKLNTYLTTLEESDKFMGSVAILEDDNVLFQNAYGMASRGQPSDINTIYRIGSITKTYTSTMLMQLVEQGEISLSDHLSEFFPEIPNADKITIEHLLHHRSGLVSITSVEEYMDYYTEGSTRQEMIDRMIEYGTNFEPGEKMEYSNSGYLILGYVIEDVTGMDYADALQNMIVEPLGLEKTYNGMDISSDRGEAQSFSFTEDEWEESPETDMSVPHGAGAIVSTPTDVGLFLNALFDGELVSMESLEKMKNLKDGYGLGIFRIPFNKRFAWGHNGGIDGFQSTSGHFPEEDLTFVLLGNGVNYSLNDIAIGTLSILFNNDFEIPDFSNEPEPVELSENELQAYTGYYTSDDIPLEIEVFIEEGVLKAKATGQGAFPLSAFEGGVMKFNPAGITMIFNSLIDGNYEGFELQQGGQSYQFTQK